MNILFLSDGIYPYVIGGMQKHSAQMVANFILERHQVTLVHCVPSGVNFPTPTEIKSKLLPVNFHPQLEVITLHFPKAGKFPGHYIRESYLYSKMVYAAIEKTFSQYDCIYIQGFSGWYLLEQKKRGIKMPVTGVHFHGLNMFQPPVNFKSRLESLLFKKPVKRILQMADVIFSYEGAFKKLYDSIGLNAKRRIFQPIGIAEETIEAQVRSCNRPLRFLFVGRNERLKALPELHQAISQISENRFRFIFIGEIPDSARLSRNDCTYLGKASDAQVVEQYQLADVLICPSYSEGMPYVVLEAMAKGSAILASNVGAIPELVSEKNGILIEPGNAKAILDAIIKFEKMNGSEIESMKNASLQQARKFTWKQIIADTISAIEKEKSATNN